VRRDLALRYVSGSDLPFAEVASMLGFLSYPAFNRAFHDWTDHSPAEYRRLRRG
jgi:AraC-like DNA-binding protein